MARIYVCDDSVQRKFYDLELTASTSPDINISVMTGTKSHVDFWMPLILMHLGSDAPNRLEGTDHNYCIDCELE